MSTLLGEGQKLKIYKNDGSSEEHLLSEIVKIEPQNLTENYQMKINKVDNTSVTKDLDDVDKLEYSNGNLLVYINGISTSYRANDIASVEFYIDSGDNYETVTIGTQVWMKKNLDISTYRDGTPIRHAASNSDWVDAGNKKEGAWCYYNNDPANGAIYGKLYNWYAVKDSRGLAPSGYHVPSDAEWTTLETYLKSNSQYWCNNNNSYIAKSLASKELWTTSINTCAIGNFLDANNSSGFSALPGGYRYYYGYFSYLRRFGYWWSATEYSGSDAWYRGLNYTVSNLGRHLDYKFLGISVRCIRD
jgi:uncharacterized protein (TIGR02145 family)